MDTTYSLDQLIERTNALLTSEKLKTFTTSTLRHYTSRQVLPKAKKVGREAKYSEEHVEAMLALRRSQSLGVTAKAHTAAKYYAEDVIESSGLNPGEHAPIHPNGIGTSAFTNCSAMEERSEIQKSAIDFLNKLDNSGWRPMPALSGSMATTPKLHALFGASSAMAEHATRSGISGLIAATSTGSELMKKITQAKPSTWEEFEIHPGLRLQVRSDLSSGGAVDQSEIMETFRRIIKTNLK